MSEEQKPTGVATRRDWLLPTFVAAVFGSVAGFAIGFSGNRLATPPDRPDEGPSVPPVQDLRAATTAASAVTEAVAGLERRVAMLELLPVALDKHFEGVGSETVMSVNESLENGLPMRRLIHPSFSITYGAELDRQRKRGVPAK